MKGGSQSRRALEVVVWALPIALSLAAPSVGVLGALAAVLGTLVFNRDARGAVLALWARGPLESLMLGATFGVVVHFAMSAAVEPALEILFKRAIDLSAMGAVEGDFAAYLQLLALGLLFGGVAEELIFRAYVIGWGAQLFGQRAGPALAVLSAVVFGAAHLYQGPAGVVSTGLIGLLLGLLYLAAGRRLAPPVFAHMALNALGITELYLGRPFLEPLIRA